MSDINKNFLKLNSVPVYIGGEISTEVIYEIRYVGGLIGKILPNNRIDISDHYKGLFNITKDIENYLISLIP